MILAARFHANAAQDHCVARVYFGVKLKKIMQNGLG